MMTRLQSGLVELAASLGEPTAGAGNRPIQLDDPKTVWFVERGALDVFLVEHRDGKPVSNPKHLLRADAGRIVFGVTEIDVPLTAMGKGVLDTSLRRISLDDLMRRADGDDIAAQVDLWVSDFAAAVTRQIWPRPRIDKMIERADAFDAESGSTVSSRPGTVVWTASSGSIYLGTQDPDPDGCGLIPLTSDSWTVLTKPTRAGGLSSRELHEGGILMPALADFHRLALGAEQLNRMLLLADEANEQAVTTDRRLRDETQARQELFGVMSRNRAVAEEGGSKLMSALGIIGERTGIDFREPPGRRSANDDETSLRDILSASGVQGRRVRLSEDDKWWRGDSGAILGFRQKDGHPVALLPGYMGRYRSVDPATGNFTLIDAERSRELEQTAWYFYRPLPSVTPAGPIDLLRTAGKNLYADLSRFITVGVLDSALMMAPAVALGFVVGAGASGSTLVQITVALVLVALLGGMFQMLRGTAMMRIEGRGAAAAAAAAWDRLLRQPQNFFRNHTAGELAVRMSVFQMLRDQLSGVVATSLFSAIFLLPALGLLFLYSAYLAWISVGIGLCALAITGILAFLQIAHQRRLYATSRQIGDYLYQFINGIGKLRAAGAERSAFAAWARAYRMQQLAKIRISRLNEHLIAFVSAVPVFAGAALLAITLRQGSGEVGAAAFLAVYAISMVFYTSIAQLGISVETLVSVIPGYEQVKPALSATQSRRDERMALANLNGDIHFDHVSFRYSHDGPLVIDDVSIHIRAGEFIAIVGRSGSGKSTLMRLALGMEEPQAGSVYYDGRDLAYLNTQSVRRQIGVVPQDGTLQPGNILENIVGISDDLTVEDAWDAARLVSVDEDIKAMPMQMFTPVSEGAATFSGGQAQRIRIAAALIRKPRILLLDEATSWLDAGSQAEVMRSIEGLAATRVIIAHRMSTISKADRIYVLDEGRVVQSGTPAELLEEEGAFRDLVQRQMV